MKISKIDYCVTLQAKAWFLGIDPKKALFGKLIVFIKDSSKEWKLESSMFLSNTAPYFDVGSEFIQTDDNARSLSPVFNLSRGRIRDKNFKSNFQNCLNKSKSLDFYYHSIKVHIQEAQNLYQLKIFKSYFLLSKSCYTMFTFMLRHFY